MRVIRCDECGAESHNPADLYVAPDSRWVLVEASEDADHDSLYGRLAVCWSCHHRSYDPGVGCERRKCGYVRSSDCTLLRPAQGVLFGKPS